MHASTFPSPPTQPVAATLAGALDVLRRILLPGLTPILALLYARTTRLLARIDRLERLWRAGALPPSHTGAPRAPAAPRPQPAEPRPRLPARRNWVESLCPRVQPARAALSVWLNRPEVLHFLAEVPRAARLLRPLCRGLGVWPLPPSMSPRPERAPKPLPPPAAPPPPGLEPAPGPAPAGRIATSAHRTAADWVMLARG